MNVNEQQREIKTKISRHTVLHNKRGRRGFGDRVKGPPLVPPVPFFQQPCAGPVRPRPRLRFPTQPCSFLHFVILPFFSSERLRIITISHMVVLPPTLSFCIVLFFSFSFPYLSACVLSASASAAIKEEVSENGETMSGLRVGH